MLWQENLVKALITDIAMAQLRLLRPSERLHIGQLQGNFLSPDQPPHLDSLELFQIATSVAVFFQLQQSGHATQLLERDNLDAWVETVIAARHSHNHSLTFCSSGSTGQAKAIQHSLEVLWREAHFWAETLQGYSTISGNVPRHHIYGFIFTVLVPAIMQQRYFDRRQQLPALAFCENPARHVLITLPNYLQSFFNIAAPASRQLCVVTSTAPCPRELAEQGMEAGIERLLHIYGSSETSGIGLRENTSTHYNLLPFIHREATGKLVRTEPGGEVCTLEIQDHLHFSNERQFDVLARKDNLVQVGGYNVNLNLVTQKLCASNLVKEAAVRLYPSPVGDRLKAFVVPPEQHIDAQQLERELLSFIRTHLPSEERPTKLTFGPALPRNENGKLQDWSIF